MTTIRSSRVMTGGDLRPASIRLEGGSVVAISSAPADLDFGDLVVMPGLVDSHVHVNEPGRTRWEGFASATKAALAGGTTTIVDMPLNSIPPTLDVAALEAKRDAADGQLWVDTAFWGGFTGDASAIPEMIEAGVCGFKAFLSPSGVEEYPSIEARQLVEAMSALSGSPLPLLLHAEDPSLLREPPRGTRSYQEYLQSRPTTAETAAIAGAAEVCAETGARTHILHVSSGEGAALIGSGPARLSGETCPHYLTFASEEIPEGATEYKCAPPIRSRDEREALWDSLRSGELAMVVSDHSPAPAQVKQAESGDFSIAWGGISSLQLRLPATWTGATRRGFGVAETCDLLSRAPAALAGLEDRKGSLEVGFDADIVVWDPAEPIHVDAEALFHRHPLTPYDGMELLGQVRAVLLAGAVAYDDGLVGSPRGRMLARR